MKKKKNSGRVAETIHIGVFYFLIRAILLVWTVFIKPHGNNTFYVYESKWLSSDNFYV